MQAAIDTSFKRAEAALSDLDERMSSGTTQIEGYSGTVQEVESTTRAGRVTVQHADPGIYGHYKLAAFSGLTTGMAANATVFAFRWGDATRVCQIERIRVVSAVITGFTAAQEIAIASHVARSWSVSDSGGASITPTTNDAKAKANYPTSLATDVRISSAAALTAGTRTLDANPFMVDTGYTLAAAATVQNARLAVEFNANGQQAHPIKLVSNEGIVIRSPIAQGAVGTVRWGVEVWWTELAAF